MRTFVIRSITRLSLIALIALSGSTLISKTTRAQDAAFECGTVDAQMKARYYSLYYEDYRNDNWPSSIIISAGDCDSRFGGLDRSRTIIDLVSMTRRIVGGADVILHSPALHWTYTYPHPLHARHCPLPG